MQTIIVDMTPGFRMPTIYYSQGDIGTQFAVDLRSRFGDSLPAGATVTIQATKPSGFGFSEAATSVTNGVAVFTTVAGMTDEAGRFAAELKVEASEITLFTANFYMNGEASTHPEGTIDGSEETVIPELTQLVERAEEAASSVLDRQTVTNTLSAGSQASYTFDEETNTQTFGIPQGEAGAGAAGVTASAYSSSKTYAVGDYVIHNSNLYRCTTAITTAEAFTAAHWTQVVLADDVSDLKSQLNGQSVSNGQLINPATVGIFTGYINSSGVFKSSSSFRTLYVPCNSNTVYTITEDTKTDTNRTIGLSTNVPVENGTCTYKGIINTNNPLVTIYSESYSYICVTFYNKSVDSNINSALANIKIQTGKLTEGYDYGGRLPVVSVGGLNANMQSKMRSYDALVDGVGSVCDVDSGINLCDLSKAVNGYYVSAAGVQANASSAMLTKIPVRGNKTYSVFQEGGNVSGLKYAFYDSNGVFVDYQENTASITSPASATHLAMSFSVSTTKLALVEGTVPIDVDYWKKIDANAVKPHAAPYILSATSVSMTTGNDLDITIPDIKKNGIYAVHMNVTTMGSITFGPGRSKPNRSAWVTVTDTNVIVHYYTANGTQDWATLAHGLTIANYLDIEIVQSDEEFSYASIKLSSNGVTYTAPELQYWRGNDTPLKLHVISGTYTDVYMTYYCKDYTKELYMFGDSYFDHWIRYVMNQGISNYLADGYSGRGSTDAVISLKKYLSVDAIPRKIFWCMGMNDGDNEAINTNWLKALTIIIDYCNQYNVELILCTIPNVATVDNTYKNAYIRTSGYRYVDLAKAVGSDVSTSWFSGLLSNDGVHPSTAGDKMIADFMISQVPEMI